MIDWDAALKALDQPLDQRLIKTRRVGGKGERGRDAPYLEGFAAIDQANRIFGYNGWGYRVEAVPQLVEVERVTDGGEVKTSSGYMVAVTVFVDGAPERTDIGFTPMAYMTADGADMAIKGAATDGLKRALRTFGPQFGNALYERDDRRQQQAEQRRPPPQQQERPTGPLSRRVLAVARQRGWQAEQATIDDVLGLIDEQIAAGVSEEQMREVFTRIGNTNITKNKKWQAVLDELTGVTK